jgi:hypothetical protein
LVVKRERRMVIVFASFAMLLALACSAENPNLERCFFEKVHGSQPAPYRVTGFAPDDLFLVEAGSRVFRFNGESYEMVHDHGEDVHLRDVWGSSPEDVFVGGRRSTGEQASEAVVIHFDGQEWNDISPHGQGSVDAMWGFGQGELYALAGNYWSSPKNIQVLHWNGEGWSVLAEMEGTSPTDLWGSSPDDLYALHGGSILRFDGSSWQYVEDEAFGDSWNGPHSVWGSAADDVFVVGNGGMVFHFDGENWTEMPGCGDGGLVSVWGNGPSDVYAVGDDGVFHFDGVVWNEAYSGVEHRFTDVWSSPGGSTFAPWRNDAFSGGGMVVGDGIGWIDDPRLAAGSIGGVWSDGAGTALGIGYSGWIYTYGDGDWEAISYLGNSAMVGPVSGASAQDVWFGGRFDICHHDGNEISISYEVPHDPFIFALRSINAVSAELVVASGEGNEGFNPIGVVYVRESGEWRLAWTGVGTVLDDSFACGPEEIWFIGTYENWNGEEYVKNHGIYMYRDGEVQAAKDDIPKLESITGLFADDVVAVGEEGAIFRYRGKGWSRQKSGTDETLSSVVTCGDGFYVASGGSALIQSVGNSWFPLPYEVTDPYDGSRLQVTFKKLSGDPEVEVHAVAQVSETKERVSLRGYCR